jgi:hypothetical protein
MRKRMWFILLALIIISSAFTACSGDTGNEKDEMIVQLENQVKDLNDTVAENIAMIQDLNKKLDISGINSDSILAQAVAVVRLIAAKDMKGLSGFVHPVKGMRFSPYAYIDIDKSLLFTAEEAASLETSTGKYTWGYYDGSGEPIELSFTDYYDRFIYDQNYASPQIIGNNIEIGSGNTPNNITDVYPDGKFVEFHFTGFDPQFEGMDWRSLRIVFELYEGKWYIVAVVHGEWTI